MAWKRPTIVEGVTKATKAFFETYDEGVESDETIALAAKATAEAAIPKSSESILESYIKKEIISKEKLSSGVQKELKEGIELGGSGGGTVVNVSQKESISGGEADTSTAVQAAATTLAAAGGGVLFFPLSGSKPYYRMKNVKIPSNVWIWQQPGVSFKLPTSGVTEESCILQYNEWTGTSHIENVGSIGKLCLDISEAPNVAKVRALFMCAVKGGYFPWIDLIGVPIQAEDGNPPMILSPTGGATTKRVNENLVIDLLTVNDSVNQQGAVQVTGCKGVKIGSILCQGGSALRIETDAVTGAGCDDLHVDQANCIGGSAITLIPHQNWISDVYVGSALSTGGNSGLYCAAERMTLGSAGHSEVLTIAPKTGTWSIALVENGGKTKVKLVFYNEAEEVLEETAECAKASEVKALVTQYATITEGTNYSAGSAEKLSAVTKCRMPRLGTVTIDKFFVDGTSGGEFEGEGNTGIYMDVSHAPFWPLYIGTLEIRNVAGVGARAGAGLHVGDAYFENIGKKAIEGPSGAKEGVARFDKLKVVNANALSGNTAVELAYLARWELGAVTINDTRITPKTTTGVEIWEGFSGGTTVIVGNLVTEGIANPYTTSGTVKFQRNGMERGIAKLEAGKKTVTALSCTTTSIILLTALTGTPIGVGVTERKAGEFKIEATATSTDEIAWAVLI